MARAKRMGAFSALDDPLAGSVVSWLTVERTPHPVQVGRMKQQRRSPRRNALDDLLPGPPEGEAPVEHAPRPTPRRQVGRNALDDLLPGPDPTSEPAAPRRRARRTAARRKPEKVWVSFEIPADVMEAVNDAAAALSGSPTRLTVGELAEQALRAEVKRLAAEHNRGRPFPRTP